MGDSELRCAIVGGQLSVAVSAAWVLYSLPSKDAAEVHGTFLRHLATDIHLNLRVLEMGPGRSMAEVDVWFAEYLKICWPAAHWSVDIWSTGDLHGMTAAIDNALSGVVVREWLATDGKSIANASTFADLETWPRLATDCDTLIRSVRFEYP